MKIRDRRLWIIYCTGVFLAMFVFFFAVHPLTLFDTDDWSYICFSRRALPLWGNWNPTRVFPEVFMPLCGSLAAYVVYPLTGNYLGSLTFVFAAVVALFIAAYIYLFGMVLRERWNQPTHKMVLWASLFLCLHFLIFRVGWNENEYLFHSLNVTCYFYYLIPDLLACCLVLYFMRNDALEDGWKKLRSGVYVQRPVRYGCLLLAMYMSLFSNLFASVILAAYIGCQLMGELITLLKGKVKWRECLAKNGFRIAFIFLWAGVQIFEVNGGRAKSVMGGGRIAQEFRNSLRVCADMGRSLSGCFKLLAIGFMLIALLLYIVNTGKGRANIANGQILSAVLKLIGMGVLVGIYTILVCTAAGSGYLYRGDVLFGTMFCFLFAIVLCGVYIADRIPRAVLLMPLILILVFFEINTTGHTFKDSLMGNVDRGTSIAVSEDIIQQFTDADAKGEKEIVLCVPHFASDDNWPIANYAANSIANALYEHGVIDRAIAVSEMIPSDEKNRELGIAVPDSN